MVIFVATPLWVYSCRVGWIVCVTQCIKLRIHDIKVPGENFSRDKASFQNSLFNFINWWKYIFFLGGGSADRFRDFIMFNNGQLEKYETTLLYRMFLVALEMSYPKISLGYI